MLGGKGHGVPTPKRVDSVQVHNTSGQPIAVTVTYDDHKNKTQLQDSATVAPGATHHFQEKMLDMGSWQAVAPVLSLSSAPASGNGPSHSLTPHVSGVVKKLEVQVHEGGALKQAD